MRHWCALLLTAIGALGCNLDSGFEELGDELISPDIGYIDAPGRQIAAGRYRRFSIRAPTLEDRYIAALEGANLVLIRFEEDGDKCEVGAARTFGTSITTEAASGLPENEPVLPYLATRDENGRGELRFSNFSCETRALSVPDVPLPQDSLAGPGSYHLIARNGSGELLAIDPWGDEPTVLGSDVSFFQISGERLWSVEQGVLVLRDAALREIGRVGTDLTEVRVSRSASNVWAAFVEGENLYLVDEETFEAPLLVSDDACRVAHVGASRERVLSFLSPCAARHLVLYDGELDGRIDYVDDVIATSVVVRTSEGFDFNYWTGPESHSGTMWIARGDAPAERVFENALIQPDVIFRTWAFAITDWNGESGDYVSWRDGTTTTIASGVAELNSLGIIANFANGVGDLLLVRGDDTTSELGSGVPLDSTKGRAFIGNSEGGRGELFVFEEPGAPPRRVAGGVTRGAFLFSVQVETLLMVLSDYDDDTDTATLQVRLLDTGDQFEVSDGVSELVEVGFPRPGVLYGVPTGDRAGLWFAGVR